MQSGLRSTTDNILSRLMGFCVAMRVNYHQMRARATCPANSSPLESLPRCSSCLAFELLLALRRLGHTSGRSQDHHPVTPDSAQHQAIKILKFVLENFSKSELKKCFHIGKDCCNKSTFAHLNMQPFG